MNIKDKIEYIKYNRFTETEKTLINTIKGAKKEQLEDRIRWRNKKGDILFDLVETNTKMTKSLLYVDYNNIWEFYSDILGLSYVSIQSLINKVITEYFDIKEDIFVTYKKPYKI